MPKSQNRNRSDQESRFNFVYFLSSLRAQTAKILICTKSGVAADPRKIDCQKVRKTSPSAQKVRTFYAKSAVFRTSWHSFWDRRKPHFLCRLMFVVVWALRLDRKYTKLNRNLKSQSALQNRRRIASKYVDK